MLSWMTLFATAVACGQGGPVEQATVAPREQRPPPTPSLAPAEGSKGPSEYSDELRGSDVRGGDTSWFEGKVTLADGRQVAMHYRRGKGLFEQHYSPQAGRWTRPHLIYGTKTDPCQGIELRAGGGTVAAIADFGLYCADGEPPTESIAAVAVGDLRRWDRHLTKNFDGWARVTIAGNGKKATFVRNSTVRRTTLVWTLAGGFADPVVESSG
jgi:hypothetical protein